MLPSTLASASLRHTSMLRRHTGTKRAESSGKATSLAGIAAIFSREARAR